MSVELVCPHCGHVNRSVGVFCAQCGQRMGTPEMRRRRERAAAPGAAGSVLRLLLLLAVASAVGLLLWPATVTPGTADETLAGACQSKVAGLLAAARAGGSAAAQFSEEEVNALLATRLARTQGADRAEGLRLALHALRVDVARDGVSAAVLAGHGPIRLSYFVRGTPEVGGGAFRLRVRSARVGHLPFPGPLAGWVGGKIAQVVGEMENERGALDAATRIELEAGGFRLATGQASP